MIEEVAEHRSERGAEAFGDLQVLLHAQIKVPVRHAVPNAGSAVVVTVVDAKNHWTEVVPHRHRVLEGVERSAGVAGIANAITSSVSSALHAGNTLSRRNWTSL